MSAMAMRSEATRERVDRRELPALALKFRSDHAPLLADIRRATEDTDQRPTRGVELTRILRVVARAYLAERLGEPPGDDLLETFLSRVSG